jgi:hypothetical protein
MRDLAIRVDGAETRPYAAAPELGLKLHLANPDRDLQVRGALLRVQVRIEPRERAHSAVEKERLEALFGRPKDWARTMRSLLWTHVSLAVPAFDDAITIDLPLPCSYDFTLATTKYFHALADGDVPLAFLFSGTVFHQDDAGNVTARPVPWSTEARYLLPHGVYRATLAHYFEGEVPLALSRDVFDRLLKYRTAGGHPTWDRALLALLPSEPPAGGAH